MNKICKDCKIDKDINEYSKQKGGKDGYKTICKKCYYVRYGAKIKEYNKNYIIENKDKRKETLKNYRINNKEKLIEYNKTYNKENKNIRDIKAKTYRENNKDKIKEYTINNKLERKEYIKNYNLNKRKTDNIFKLKQNISNLIRMYIKRNGYTKNSKTFDILGCTYEFFLEYIKNQFEPWMTLENNGIYTGNYNETWQIDHIIPISNATNEDEVIKLNHYTNLRPLCSRKNIEKSNIQI